MSDKEMFELAAKAAGIKIKGFYSDGTPFSDVNGVNEIWNPRDDDSDALRLAVKLNFEVRICNGVAVVNDGHSDLEHVEVDGNNPYAATRRAIVRAAAEIGRVMK